MYKVSQNEKNAFWFSENLNKTNVLINIPKVIIRVFIKRLGFVIE